MSNVKHFQLANFTYACCFLPFFLLRRLENNQAGRGVCNSFRAWRLVKRGAKIKKFVNLQRVEELFSGEAESPVAAALAE
jgi:hypothetical protein